MTDTSVEVATRPDGSLVLQPHGVVGPEDAVALRQAVVHAVRHLRPLRLILDLHAVTDVDPINLGALAAACGLGDDHHVIVYVDHSSPRIAQQLCAAGVAPHRLRHIAA